MRSYLVGAVALLSVSAELGAAPVTHWSQAGINSSGFVNFSPDYANTVYGNLFDFSGNAVELQFDDTRSWAFGNGDGGVVFREESSDVFARADLSTGELKARSYLSHGSNTGGTAPAFGARAGSASADAALADGLSFGNAAGGDYIWQAGDEFTFEMDVHGEVTLPGHPAPNDYRGALSFSTLSLLLLRPGGLDILDQFNNFDYDAYPDFDAADAELSRLGDLFDPLFIESTSWCLGPVLAPGDFCVAEVSLDGDGKGTATHTFDPGGDFEFLLTLDTQVRIDLAFENILGDIDFSNTVDFGFTAPGGATVFSSSGILPDTAARATAGSVPVPAIWTLLFLGMLGMLRKRHK